MDRSIDRDERQSPDRNQAPAERTPGPRAISIEPVPSREHAIVRERGYAYRLSPAELETMRDIGRFRTVAIVDLARYRYSGEAALMNDDLRSLQAQGLVQHHTAWNGPRSKKLDVVVLSKLGKAVVERHGRLQNHQSIYAGFVKRHEVRHDAAIYRMYHVERQKIERAGGLIRRVVLDYELKRKVYAPLARVKALPPAEYAKRQIEVARTNGLTVVAGKIPLPDLRIEYETAHGDLARVDLELTTGHYHGPALAAKAQAGFKMYAADGSGARLHRLLEERDIVATILSL